MREAIFGLVGVAGIVSCIATISFLMAPPRKYEVPVATSAVSQAASAGVVAVPRASASAEVGVARVRRIEVPEVVIVGSETRLRAGKWSGVGYGTVRGMPAPNEVVRKASDLRR